MAAPSVRRVGSVSLSTATHSAAIPGISLSTLYDDGLKRCWGGSLSSSALHVYHDDTWGRALKPGSGRSLFRQLILQTFQSGLSWNTILGKVDNFEARFEGFDYEKVARWGEVEIAAAITDAGIVRNGAKVRSAVANAEAAVRLDRLTPGGFEDFVWKTCGRLPDSERLLKVDSRSGTHMRASTKDDYLLADGVHPTISIVAAVKAFKQAGFQFLGPATMLSFVQAIGLCNHHKPDCSAFQAAEESFAAATAAFASRATSSTAITPVSSQHLQVFSKKRSRSKAEIPLEGKKSS